MSGGHFEYHDMSLKREMFGFGDKPRNVLEDMELSELAFDLLDVIHAYDWYVCGDTCKETYIKSKCEFKKKWFENHEMNVQRIVDDAINNLKLELCETFLSYNGWCEE